MQGLQNLKSFRSLNYSSRTVRNMAHANHLDRLHTNERKYRGPIGAGGQLPCSSEDSRDWCHRSSAKAYLKNSRCLQTRLPAKTRLRALEVRFESSRNLTSPADCVQTKMASRMYGRGDRSILLRVSDDGLRLPNKGRESGRLTSSMVQLSRYRLYCQLHP